MPLFEATWEDFSLVSTQFPEFHLEDKVKVWARGPTCIPGAGVIKEVLNKMGRVVVIFYCVGEAFQLGEYFFVFFGLYTNHH